MRLWSLHSGTIREVVRAPDQFAAWSVLRDRDAEEFGFLVAAEPDENGDPLLVRTSALMLAWGRDDDARAFVEAAIEAGMPDTTAKDCQFAEKHR
jgi:hypothetical protein